MTSRAWSRVAVMITAAALVAVVPAAPAVAHPLGNFSVNHFNGLTLQTDRVELLTIIDTAEIPTQQVLPSIDLDGDDVMSGAELAAQADAQCADVAAALALQIDNRRLALRPGTATLEAVPGAAGLPTLRLTCPATAAAELDQPAVVTFADAYRPDRVGWHEITALGAGVRLLDSPVPSTSLSDELRSYPENLLESPLDQRSMTVRVEPGTSGPTDSFDPASDASNPFTRLVAAGDRTLQGWIGGTEVTPLVGALAVLLAIVLGAGHAMLPGHGKTVIAAYLAGRRGSRRDAWLVGGTVTLAHTASVLVLGLLISLSANVIGEQVLRSLGIVSGLLIAAVGLALLIGALRARRQAAAPAHVHEHELVHAHAPAQDGHSHDHDHDHRHSHQPHSHGLLGGHTHQAPAGGRLGIVGMGLAGGLVPSPSALVVLLGAVALGRTVFGVLLVLAYGLGMAGTLTAVGLLLVRFGDRVDRFGPTNRLRRALPVLTAILVLVVGIGLVVRGVLLAG